MAHGTCLDCGSPTRFSHSVRCRACYMAAHMKGEKRPRCADCDTPISYARTRCTSCHYARVRAENALAAPACEGCGGPVSSAKTRRCMACISKESEAKKAAFACVNCGASLSNPKARQCRSCFIAQAQRRAEEQRAAKLANISPPKVKKPAKDACPKCGELKSAHRDICRSCWKASLPKYTCRDCGKELTNGQSVQCRDCWMRDHMANTSRPACQDCGKEISWAVGRPGARRQAKRCMQCENVRRHENRVIVLAETARPNAVRSDPESRWSRQKRWLAFGWRNTIAKMPCAICGYNRIPCHIHRLIPKNGYVYGNVVQVCPNCHEEIHKKLIDPPAPFEFPSNPLETDV